MLRFDVEAQCVMYYGGCFCRKRDKQEPPKDDGMSCGWGQKIRYVACQSSSAATNLKRCTEAGNELAKKINVRILMPNLIMYN